MAKKAIFKEIPRENIWLNGSIFSAVLYLGEQKPAVKDAADDIPYYQRNQVLHNTVYEPANYAYQHHRIIEETDFTGAFQLINPDDLRNDGKSSQQTGGESQVFDRRQSKASLNKAR
jgi:hypothetical protein